MRLTRKYEAEAAHQLSAGVPDGHPCKRFHGHRYEIWVSIIGDVDPSTGMLLEYNEIDARVQKVLDAVDHRFLNELGFEVSVVPGGVFSPTKPIAGFEFKEPDLAAKVRENSTVEHLALWFKAELTHRFPRTNMQVGALSFLSPQVYSVRIREDSRSEVEV